MAPKSGGKSRVRFARERPAGKAAAGTERTERGVTFPGNQSLSRRRAAWAGGLIRNDAEAADAVVQRFWPEFGKISTPISVKNERSSGGECRRCYGNVLGPRSELGRESGWRLSSLRENSHGTNGDGASAHSQRVASATFRMEWID